MILFYGFRKFSFLILNLIFPFVNFFQVDSFPLDQEDSIEIPDSGSDCENEADDNDEDGDEDDEEDDDDEDDDEDVHNNSDMDTKFLFDNSEVSDTDPSPNDTKARLEALLEAAGMFLKLFFLILFLGFIYTKFDFLIFSILFFKNICAPFNPIIS